MPKKRIKHKNNFKRIKKFKFSGNKYNIIWKKPPKSWGLCFEPDKKGSKMYIDPYQTELDLLITVIDETIHANNFSIDNDYVADMSDSIGNFLFNMGWRLNNEKDKSKTKTK